MEKNFFKEAVLIGCKFSELGIEYKYDGFGIRYDGDSFFIIS